MTLFTNVTGSNNKTSSSCNGSNRSNSSSSSSSISTNSNSSRENCLEYNKTWPSKDNSYDNTGFTTVASSYEYTIPEAATDLDILNTPTTDATKRYQTKMLLASLIEHFCRAYGDTPDANRKVFFLICQTLRSLGIIDSEFVDEMTSVRSSFQQAFQKLFYTAVQTVQNQDLVPFDDGRSPKLIKHEQTDYFSLSSEPATSTGCFSNSPTRLSSSTNSALHSFVLGNLSVQNSRYNHDFVEINLLGKGGFASAFRARNKLDGIDYAVKKIRLGNNIEDEAGDNPYERIFREIKNLARLEHNNVIRYYSSWLEFDESNSDETDTSDEESDLTRSENVSSVFEGQDPTFDMSESGMSQIMFAESSATCEPTCTNETLSSFAKPLGHEQDEEASLTATSQSGWTLFIQMQLCPTTLHDYIKFRNKQFAENNPSNFAMDRTHKNRNIEIFSQILQGTAYIHDQGLIHRDLKPSNIFLSIPNVPHDNSKKRRSSNAFLDTVTEKNWQEAWVPKIGDFGLAAEVMDESDLLLSTPLSSGPPSPTTQRHKQQVRRASVYEGRPIRPRPKRTRTVGVGTRTYASPEQLAVPVQPYDEKVDIYSLGIILFELFQPFTTGMERAESIENLKQGVFPSGFLEMYPKVSALILWMMDKDSKRRPSAHQLLEFELFSQPEDLDIYLNLQTQLENKSHIIDELKKTVTRVQQEKQDALSEMQKKLDAMQLQLDNLHLDKPNTTTTTTRKKEVRWS
ncbi:hypothetical protein HPULCUR_009644 [Helicostylum pulchrum]|uniref:non-specific serine/threonine protein kinase n=1 Tax=Helicostylum pulchrum TaxID=562976 RepID=A0ABP9YC54_9FUNG